MLLRVQGTATEVDNGKYKLNLDIPTLYLDDANYNISLRMIMLELDILEKTPSHQFWSLSTTAVDQSAVNPTQEIASFYSPIEPESDFTCIVYYEPNIKREYKLQLTSVHSSDFILTAKRSDAALEIRDIVILFELSRYARV